MASKTRNQQTTDIMGGMDEISSVTVLDYKENPAVDETSGDFIWCDSDDPDCLGNAVALQFE